MKKNYAQYFLVFIMLFALQKTTAQVALYNFSQSAGTYSPITGGTILGNNSNDDDVFDYINIGFTFNFNNFNFTQVSICSDGFLKLGSVSNNPTINFFYSPISDPFSDDTIVSALGGDMESNPAGVLQYKTIGSAPSRTFVVQWSDYTSWGNSDILNFQIRLNETTNVIEASYGSNTIDTYNYFEVGLRGDYNNSDYNNRSVLIATDTWATSTAGTSISDYCEIDSGPQFAPSNGQFYKWSPGACTVPVVTLTASQSSVCGGTSVTLTALGANSYSWNTTATTNTIAVTPNTTTAYTVTGDNGPGCTDTKTITINVTPAPVITFSASPGFTICPGGSANIAAMGATNYTWSLGSQTTAVINVTPSISQVYNIIGTNASGCSTSTNVTVFVVSCTGLNNQVAAVSNINVYPNPTKGELVIDLANGENKNVQLLDVTGRIMFEKNTTNDRTELNISDLSNGIYYVRILSGNTVEVRKIIKE